MSRRLRSGLASTLEDPYLNLTPLIDVVFVVLIIFIVVAPLVRLDEVELANGPSTTQKAPSANQGIQIHVRANNSLTLNSEPTTLAQLKPKLKTLKERFPNERPLIFHDKKAHFGTYQELKNTLEASGFQQMDIVLKPS